MSEGYVKAEKSNIEAAKLWATYLFVSPTRSSLTGAAPADELERLLALHNGEVVGDIAPSETELLRPWRLAEYVLHDNCEKARQAAWRVARASGFRARLSALRARCVAEIADDVLRSPTIQECLDGLTYATVQFLHPTNPSEIVSALALVDTGSTDCDLRQEFIDQLGLPLDNRGGGIASFETAANRKLETSIYRTRIRVQGRDVIVRVTPIDEDEDEDSDKPEDDVDKVFGFGSTTDHAVLGHRALASLGLLVDCQHRRLVEPPNVDLPALNFVGPQNGSPHVPFVISDLHVRERQATVRALVDSGCTDIDLDRRVIKALGLVVDASEGSAQFETAGGVTIEAPIYRALAHALGREASVRVSPSEEEDGSDDETALPTSQDEALLGHDALAALGLLVDCRNRQLLLSPIS